MQTEEDNVLIANKWLEKFGFACTSGDLQAFTDLFLAAGGFLRDNLVFSWRHRTLFGKEAIGKYVENSLSNTGITRIKLDLSSGIIPNYASETNILEAAFVFETSIAYGRGIIMLQPYEQTWKALVVYITLSDLKGYEEKGPDPKSRLTEGFQAKKNLIETNPHVLIIGAGQSGLNFGARFKQMDIPTLIIDRADRVGDVWRKRYPSLTLHTPKPHHSLLYDQLPSNWPDYTPRDKVAMMIEHYSQKQDLVIWLRSTMVPQPSYDMAEKRWTVQINRDGKHFTLRPFHIVIATSYLGRPLLPTLPERDQFIGEVFHGTDFKGPSQYVGKKVVVVGASQTAADICQDLALNGVGSVTMIQRSSTSVVTIDWVRTLLDILWPANKDPSIGDFRAAAMPLLLLKQIHVSMKEKRLAYHKEVHEGLMNAGFKLNEDPDGAGQGILLFQRGGGYWLDVGSADLVIKGKIRVKNGVEPTHFTPSGIVFNDGSELDADAVIFATGYAPPLEIASDFFGEEIGKKITPIWGLNEEGELKRACTPSGHPGIWWGIGDFSHTRYYSKSLGIQIKARELGLVPEDEF